MTPGGTAPLQSQFTVYATFCLTGLVAFALVTEIGLGGYVGVVVAFAVMGLLAVGLLLLYGQYFASRVESAEPPLGPNGGGS
ncbi:hypothetical protein [Haloarchaeobius sp. HME9146]|uniref:hypothetical protein n=1 Tax=Haloarchaeobius sp. HME9146 TaxID=2978732 RepID=UPI0021C18C64|nr:hypothetical protein [Haloarchaeobius sp. HME9146]MCT9096770.1 hypothetical protein [Haloarchaeobius sp. HME9146]